MVYVLPPTSYACARGKCPARARTVLQYDHSGGRTLIGPAPKSVPKRAGCCGRCFYGAVQWGEAPSPSPKTVGIRLGSWPGLEPRSIHSFLTVLSHHRPPQGTRHAPLPRMSFESPMPEVPRAPEVPQAVAPFGLWKSEITEDAVFSSSRNMSSPRVCVSKLSPCTPQPPRPPRSP